MPCSRSAIEPARSSGTRRAADLREDLGELARRAGVARDADEPRRIGIQRNRRDVLGQVIGQREVERLVRVAPVLEGAGLRIGADRAHREQVHERTAQDRRAAHRRLVERGVEFATQVEVAVAAVRRLDEIEGVVGGDHPRDRVLLGGAEQARLTVDDHVA